jgi:hypothetical protein
MSFTPTPGEYAATLCECLGVTRQGYDRLSGGGCMNSGDCIHDVHAGFGVTQAEFYGRVQILNDAMVRPRLAIRGRNESCSPSSVP